MPRVHQADAFAVFRPPLWEAVHSRSPRARDHLGLGCPIHDALEIPRQEELPKPLKAEKSTTSSSGRVSAQPPTLPRLLDPQCRETSSMQ